MALSEADRQAKIRETHESSWAMVEDIEHIRDVLSKLDPNSGDIRRLSNILRRILIDNSGDLRKIAPPRIGRLHLLVPDILPLIRSGEKQPYAFLSAGIADVFGLSIDAWMAEAPPRARQVDGYQPGRNTEVRMDGFLSQKIICVNGQWATRGDAIKYIANIAHGVHSGTAREPKEELLHRARYMATISLDSMIPTISYDVNASTSGERPINVDRRALDFVLVQLASAARYLTISPDIQRLEEIIRSETL